MTKSLNLVTILQERNSQKIFHLHTSLKSKQLMCSIFSAVNMSLLLKQKPMQKHSSNDSRSVKIKLA